LYDFSFIVKWPTIFHLMYKMYLRLSINTPSSGNSIKRSWNCGVKSKMKNLRNKKKTNAPKQKRTQWRRK